GAGHPVPAASHEAGSGRAGIVHRDRQAGPTDRTAGSVRRLLRRPQRHRVQRRAVHGPAAPPSARRARSARVLPAALLHRRLPQRGDHSAGAAHLLPGAGRHRDREPPRDQAGRRDRPRGAGRGGRPADRPGAARVVAAEEAPGPRHQQRAHRPPLSARAGARGYGGQDRRRGRRRVPAPLLRAGPPARGDSRAGGRGACAHDLPLRRRRGAGPGQLDAGDSRSPLSGGTMGAVWRRLRLAVIATDALAMLLAYGVATVTYLRVLEGQTGGIVWPLYPTLAVAVALVTVLFAWVQGLY